MEDKSKITEPSLTEEFDEKQEAILTTVPSVRIKIESEEYKLSPGSKYSNFIYDHELQLPPIQKDDIDELEDKDFFISEKELIEIKEECMIDPAFQFLSTECETALDNEEVDVLLEPGSSGQIRKHLKNKSKVKHKRKNVYYCPVCMKKFRTPLLRKRHLSKHFGRNLVTCYLCGQMFAQQILYLDHLLRHFIKRRKLVLFKCDMCLKRFRTKFQLAEHIMFAHFMDDEHSKANKFVVNTVKLLQCKLCTKPFRHKYQLDQHYINIHCADIKPEGTTFLCPRCPKVFENSEALSVHLSDHPSPKVIVPRAFKCQYCLMLYNKKETWDKHILTHITAIEPIVHHCEICLVHFKKKEIYDNHVNVNKVKEPYQCQACLQYFTLKCHQFTPCGKSIPRPPVDKRHICCICHTEFTSNLKLRQHTDNAHVPVKTKRSSK